MRLNRAILPAVAALLAIGSLVSAVMAADMDGVIMSGGKMMLMKDGKAMTPMPSDMMMSNGTKVMTDGTMMTKDGTKAEMKEGRMMMMDGKIMEGGKATAMGNH